MKVRVLVHASAPKIQGKELPKLIENGGGWDQRIVTYVKGKGEIKPSFLFLVKAKIIFFSSKHPAQFWEAPIFLFNELQQESCRSMKLTTFLHLVSRLRVSGLLVLLHLHDFVLCTGTTIPSLPMKEHQAISQFESSVQALFVCLIF